MSRNAHLAHAIFILIAPFLSSLNIHNFTTRWGSRIVQRLFRPKTLVQNVRSDDDLKKGIAKFYDESSGIWLDVWGDDMHHGYYPSRDFKDHKQAQIMMIEKSLEFAYGNQFKDQLNMLESFVDVGCGVGGSSRHIAKMCHGKGVGLSLSPYQIMRANEYTKTANLSERLQYIVADAMKMPFADQTFNLTWSMESGEHMPNKRQFLNELFRVTSPGGRIIIVTWCHRELSQTKDGVAISSPLTDKEIRLLKKINDAYYLPDWVPASQYLQIATELGLEDIRTEDWSEYTAPFWPAVIKTIVRPRNIFRILRSGRTLFKGVIASWWMLRGFTKGLVRFVIITGRKPNHS